MMKRFRQLRDRVTQKRPESPQETSNDVTRRERQEVKAPREAPPKPKRTFSPKDTSRQTNRYPNATKPDVVQHTTSGSGKNDISDPELHMVAIVESEGSITHNKNTSDTSKLNGNVTDSSESGDSTKVVPQENGHGKSVVTYSYKEALLQGMRVKPHTQSAKPCTIQTRNEHAKQPASKLNNFDKERPSSAKQNQRTNGNTKHERQAINVTVKHGPLPQRTRNGRVQSPTSPTTNGNQKLLTPPSVAVSAPGENNDARKDARNEIAVKPSSTGASNPSYNHGVKGAEQQVCPLNRRSHNKLDSVSKSADPSNSNVSAEIRQPETHETIVAMTVRPAQQPLSTPAFKQTSTSEAFETGCSNTSRGAKPEIQQNNDSAHNNLETNAKPTFSLDSIKDMLAKINGEIADVQHRNTMAKGERELPKDNNQIKLHTQIVDPIKEHTCAQQDSVHQKLDIPIHGFSPLVTNQTNTKSKTVGVHNVSVTDHNTSAAPGACEPVEPDMLQSKVRAKAINTSTDTSQAANMLPSLKPMSETKPSEQKQVSRSDRKPTESNKAVNVDNNPLGDTQSKKVTAPSLNVKPVESNTPANIDNKLHQTAPTVHPMAQTTDSRQQASLLNHMTEADPSKNLPIEQHNGKQINNTSCTKTSSSNNRRLENKPNTTSKQTANGRRNRKNISKRKAEASTSTQLPDTGNNCNKSQHKTEVESEPYLRSCHVMPDFKLSDMPNDFYYDFHENYTDSDDSSSIDTAEEGSNIDTSCEPLKNEDPLEIQPSNPDTEPSRGNTEDNQCSNAPITSSDTNTPTLASEIKDNSSNMADKLRPSQNVSDLKSIDDNTAATSGVETNHCAINKAVRFEVEPTIAVPNECALTHASPHSIGNDAVSQAIFQTQAVRNVLSKLEAYRKRNQDTCASDDDAGKSFLQTEPMCGTGNMVKENTTKYEPLALSETTDVMVDEFQQRMALLRTEMSQLRKTNVLNKVIDLNLNGLCSSVSTSDSVTDPSSTEMGTLRYKTDSTDSDQSNICLSACNSATRLDEDTAQCDLNNDIVSNLSRMNMDETAIAKQTSSITNCDANSSELTHSAGRTTDSKNGEPQKEIDTKSQANNGPDGPKNNDETSSSENDDAGEESDDEDSDKDPPKLLRHKNKLSLDYFENALSLIYNLQDEMGKMQQQMEGLQQNMSVANRLLLDLMQNVLSECTS